MEVSLDLILTAVMNILVVIGGVAYLYWSGKRKKSAPVPDPAPPAPENVREEKAAAPVPSAAKQAARDAKREREYDAAEAAPPAKTDGAEYVGTVKRYSDRNGMGFIVCEATHTLYDIDVRIFSNEYKAAGLAVGDNVSFQVVLGTKSADKRRQHPWATGVKRLDSSNGKLRSDKELSPGSKMNAGASEFVPSGQQTSGRRLNSAAAEFIPGGIGDPSIWGGPGPAPPPPPPSDGLNAAAREFVPSSPPKGGNLRANAMAFVPEFELVA